ncbi:MAG: GAF domain-containing sensor histidine kinase [Candidatus Gastranaerophilales bacterium]|nr:GAF domain-containing sensor histidine kinase [Candidatus Gastranaerophilales bacterium]
MKIKNKVMDNLSKEELINALENSRLETFKYVNRLLEVQEKWAFINILLKKLNSIKQKQELCKTICEGFLKLTNSKVCSCCLFNPDNRNLEFRKIASEEEFDQRELTNFIDKINVECCRFLEKSIHPDEISEYFQSVSGNQFIIVPIFYSETFLGYLMLIKEDNNFYDENIHFVNIFPEHIALILENISLYQESEKQNKRKIEFLAGISHEFKTPLNSIIGFTELLREKDESPDNQKYINNILKSARHLLTLIEDILDVSKSQYNKLELNYSTFTPKDEIVQVVLALEEMFKEKNIDLNYTLTDIKISADIKRFRQLIFNLMSNAVKFNKQNGKIDIFTYIKDNKFFFEITDTGDGISKRNYDKIFDFFSQVNRSQLKRQLGSGVGLALCKMITDAHKGEINFKSQIKKGSTFWFSLPLARS